MGNEASSRVVPAEIAARLGALQTTLKQVEVNAALTQMWLEKAESALKLRQEIHSNQLDRVARAKAELEQFQKQVFRSKPDAPGMWYWGEWDCEVKVYTKKGKGRRLYVTPPGGIEVLITPRIAGGWIALAKHSANNRVSDSERCPAGESSPVNSVHSA